MTKNINVELRDLALKVGQRAAGFANYKRAAGVSVAYSKSAINDIVTEVDRETEQLVRSLIMQERPDDGFIGEEFEATPSKTGISWVVDPIDGTVNFLYGLAPHTVSIAAVKGDVNGEWEPIAGAIVTIPFADYYYAAAGDGAYRNGCKIVCSQKSDIATSLISTGYSYLPEIRARQHRVIGKLIEKVRDIRRIGCASFDFCAVACGALDLYFERGLKPWDYAAGTLIARESGAIVKGFDSDLPGERLSITGNEALVNVLYPLIKQAMLEENL